MAKHIKIDGTVEEVIPDGKMFSLEEMQKYVGGYIEMPELPSGGCMVINENGRLDGLAKNELASKLWRSEFPITEYGAAGQQDILGDVLVLHDHEYKLLKEDDGEDDHCDNDDEDEVEISPSKHAGEPDDFSGASDGDR